MSSTLNKIINTDCVEGMKKLPDQFFDIVIADPPYNLSKGNSWTWKRAAGLPGFGGDWNKVMAEWDDLPLKDYFLFTLLWLSEIKRLLKPSGSLWVHGTYHNIGIINFVMQILEIEIINEVIWYKRNSFPNLSGRRLTASHETIIWAHTGRKRKYLFNYNLSKSMLCFGDQLKNNGKQMRTVWDIPNNKDKWELKFGKHPTQKPLRLLRRVLEISSKKGDVCLVPFAGSGSECIAALMCGLNFVGFESDKQYVELANNRLLDFNKGNLTLFK